LLSISLLMRRVVLVEDLLSSILEGLLLLSRKLWFDIPIVKLSIVRMLCQVMGAWLSMWWSFLSHVMIFTTC
jgi:hypothetical protein